MLGTELRCIFCLQRVSYRSGKTKAEEIFIAGTSLRINEATSAIQHTHLSYLKPHFMAGCNKHTEFPLLTTREDFKKLLEQHGISDTIQDSKMVRAIEKNSIPLRGHYRWSVRYVISLRQRNCLESRSTG
jgi:hypothetical protein